MARTPSDDVLESLYKLRIRESDQVETALEFFDMEIHEKIVRHEIHQKISSPDYRKLKTMVKRSIDQNSDHENLTPEKRGFNQVSG